VTGESNREESRVQTFLAMLQSQPTEADCQQCVEQLAAYVEAQFEGSNYQMAFPHVAQHLDSCVICAEAYAQMYELVLADRNDRLPEPSYIPQPDLSFLTQPPLLWAALQSALQQTQTHISLQLDATLVALLSPQPSLTMTRAGDDAQFGEQILTLTSDQIPVTDLPFSLAAYADKENQELCLVEITVEPPGLSWPDLGGSEVHLSYNDGVKTGTTDDWGTAVFANIPRTELENLHLDITLK